MAVPNSEYANELIAATFQEASGQIYDQVYKETALLDWFRRHQDVVTGGEKVTTKLRYAGAGRGTGFATGTSFDLAQSDQYSRAMFPWFNYGTSVLIFDQHVMVNSGQAQIMNLAEEKKDEAVMDIADAMASDLTASSYTDQDESVIPALDVVLDATSTIGGIAYDAFPGTNFEWQARVTSSVTFSLGMLETIYNNCGLGKGGRLPTDLFAAQNMIESYKLLAGDYAMIPHGDKGGRDVDLGFEKVWFRGKPMSLDTYLADGEILLLNSKNIRLVAHTRNSKRFITERKPVSATPGAVEHSIWGMFSFRVHRRASLGRCHTITAVS